MFLDMTELGTLAHVTDEEAADALRICNDAKTRFKTTIACIPVDNGAKAMADKVVAGLEEACHVSRDPAHCGDLISKDLAGLNFMKPILAELKEVYDFVKTDRIDSMRVKANTNQVLGAGERCPTATNKVDTRMNLVHDYATNIRKQASFLVWLPTSEDYRKYLAERNQRDRDKITSILSRCTPDRWSKIDYLTSTLTVHVKRFHKLCCMGNVPLSAYILLCQALRNAINKHLLEDPAKFDQLFGQGAKQELINASCRFNMDGSAPVGTRKVGLVDKFHIWAFLCDPYNFKFRAKFKIEGILNLHVKEMINFYVPRDSDGSERTRLAVRTDFDVSVKVDMICLVHLQYLMLTLFIRTSILCSLMIGSTPLMSRFQCLSLMI